LKERGAVDASTCRDAIARYGLAADDAAPWTR
jgi:hypothetical protein